MNHNGSIQTLKASERDRLIRPIRSYESLPPGWVYAMQEYDAPLVKIGRATTVDTRLKAIEKTYHTRVTLVASAYVPCLLSNVEYELHQHFSAQHIAGEWFYLSVIQEEFTSLVVSIFNVLLLQEASNYKDVRSRWLYPGKKRFSSRAYTMDAALGAPYHVEARW